MVENPVPDAEAAATTGDREGLAAAVPAPFSAASGRGVSPSGGCGCESCKGQAGATGRAQTFAPGSLVFALGQLGYDLVSEARRTSLQQHLWEFRARSLDVAYEPDRPPTLGEANPADPDQMIAYFEDRANRWDVSAVHWVVNVFGAPVYAIQPEGPFARDVYSLLVRTLREQLDAVKEDRVDWVSIPGRLGGHAWLSTGQVVPAIIPEPRGIYGWNTSRLIERVAPDAAAAKVELVQEFLDRIQHELANFGLTPRERALNYAATNVVQLGGVADRVLREKDPMALDAIDATPSALCPPGTECWDVTLTFFHPERAARSPGRAFRFSVDVSDVVPVMVGPVRSWSTR
jgi:cyanobactin maturation PatA/PatG family protease